MLVSQAVVQRLIDAEKAVLEQRPVVTNWEDER